MVASAMPTTLQNFDRAPSLILATSFASCSPFRNCVTGNGFLRVLIDHHRETDAAVRVTAAVQLAPIRLRTVRQIGPVGEGAHERDREPVPRGLAEADLVLHVMRKVR